jgi:hypothetical protein
MCLRKNALVNTKLDNVHIDVMCLKTTFYGKYFHFESHGNAVSIVTSHRLDN